jgi:hypothetical protein
LTGAGFAAAGATGVAAFGASFGAAGAAFFATTDGARAAFGSFGAAIGFTAIGARAATIFAAGSFAVDGATVELLVAAGVGALALIALFVRLSTATTFTGVGAGGDQLISVITLSGAAGLATGFGAIA